jgi:hypothetical protein
MIVVILIGWMSPSKANLGPVLELPADSLVWLNPDGCDRRLMFVIEGRVLGPPRTGRLKREMVKPMRWVLWQFHGRHRFVASSDGLRTFRLTFTSNGDLTRPDSVASAPQTDKPTPHHFMA